MNKEEVLNQIELAHSLVFDLSEKSIEKYKKQFSNIIFSSIGKSGMIERVVHDIGTDIPTEVFSESMTPNINQKSLAVVISYNGRTREILDFYLHAQQRTKKIIVISANHELLSDAQANGFLPIQFPSGLDSATSFFLSMFTAIFLLHKLNVLSISETEIQEAIFTIGNFSKNFKTFKYTEDIHHKIPLIYTWNEFSCLGFILSSYFNIHAKSFAIRSSIPEADFNEIEALSYGDEKVVPIYLMPMGKKYEKARLIMNTFKHSSPKMQSLTFDMQGESKLAQIVHTILFFQFVTERLGKRNHIDPSSREAISELREKLKHL